MWRGDALLNKLQFMETYPSSKGIACMFRSKFDMREETSRSPYSTLLPHNYLSKAAA